ncbi:MAG: GNAT family N-acetyltransferase [Acidimicrobiia bacterium]|nr:GNAT family N-acetyltransferase [Acidimicrobiia bacterium]
MAVDDNEVVLEELRLRASTVQVERLCEWAGRFEKREWAVESANGLGYLIAQQLLAAGETVFDVPAVLASRVRLLGSIRAWEPVFSSFEQVLGPDLYRRLYPDWRSQQRASVEQALASNETWVRVAEAQVTGFVNVIFDAGEKVGEIHMIAVDPRSQRRGIATDLTELAVAEMTRRGLTLATVSTGGDPGHAPARRTYEKAGFASFPQML